MRRSDGLRTYSFRTPANLLIVVIALSGGVVVAAQKPDAQKTLGADAKRLAEVRRRAVEFLKTSQADDGSWTSNSSGGVTALVVMALIDIGVPLDDPTIAKGLRALEKLVQKDGGIYATGSGQKNYETCVCVMALKAADVGGKYDAVLARADKFLRGLQWDEKEGIDKSDTRYGGADYGPSKRRPDLSNTQFLLDALRALGAKDDDPSIQKALVFVSRCQNLESEHNTTTSAAKVNDGGFIYTVASGGQSAAGKARGGGLRSYGAMTYAGLKSMIYAGLTDSDPRVKAAFGWIRSHYTVTENPGMGVQGLYYYYDTFSKTLDVLKIKEFEDAQHEKHDWRKDLATQLFSAQQPNGSWVNPKGRWFEGDPNLATAYALRALKYCEPTDTKSHLRYRGNLKARLLESVLGSQSTPTRPDWASKAGPLLGSPPATCALVITYSVVMACVTYATVPRMEVADAFRANLSTDARQRLDKIWSEIALLKGPQFSHGISREELVSPASLIEKSLLRSASPDVPDFAGTCCTAV